MQSCPTQQEVDESLQVLIDCPETHPARKGRGTTKYNPARLLESECWKPPKCRIYLNVNTANPSWVGTTPKAYPALPGMAKEQRSFSHSFNPSQTDHSLVLNGNTAVISNLRAQLNVAKSVLEWWLRVGVKYSELRELFLAPPLSSFVYRGGCTSIQ